MDDITNYVIIGHNLIIRYNIIYAITIRYYWVVRIFKIIVACGSLRKHKSIQNV